jgi:MoaA/NifB/PqqE/SkfB family radical SAM enzyme
MTLITNGTKLTSHLVHQFDELSVSLSISLDTLDRNKYQRIRGADQLNEVLARPKFLTCIVSELNLDEVNEIVAFAGQRGFLAVVGAYHWDVGLYGKQDATLMYDRQRARQVFERLLEHDILPPGYLRQYTKDNIAWLRGEALKPCDAGKYSIAIDASGMFRPVCRCQRPGISSILRFMTSSRNLIEKRFSVVPIGRRATGWMGG